MAPAALAAPIASISPHSGGRAALAGGRHRSGRTTCLAAGHSGTFATALCKLYVLSLRRLVDLHNLLLYAAALLRQDCTATERAAQTSETEAAFRARERSDDSKPTTEKTPFGYTRKDVLLIGVGVTLVGVALKYGLELAGVDPLQAGNVVQLVIVLGMTVGWISTYMFRVANKDMTYAKQLRDYEKQVMEKRLESLSEVELQVLLEQVEEEKQRLEPVGDQGVTFNRKTEGPE